jgi:hypothetical protein
LLRKAAFLLSAACVFAGGVRGAGAGAPRALPAFKVTSSAGAEVSSSDLSARDRWLLVYVAPGSRTCDALLNALRDWKTPALIDRTVILVGAERSDAAGLMNRSLSGDMAAIRWYADAAGNASKALGLKGVPVIVGVLNGKIEWTVNGVMNDAAQLQSIVRNWVEGNPPR